MSERPEFDERLRDNATLISSIFDAETWIFLIQGDILIAASHREEQPLTSFDEARPRLTRECSYVVGDKQWWRNAVSLGPQGSQADLYVGCTIATSPVTGMKNILNMVCRGIERDWMQQETIASLSFELGNRYEELNLLYGIDDSLGSPGNESAEVMIGTVLDNCLEFLNVDGVAIQVPDHDIEVARFFDEDPILLNFSDSAGVGAVKNRVRFGEGPLVHNGNAADPPKVADTELPFQLLATPVYEGPQRIVGILFFVRKLDSEPFSTSDRKISSVIASELSKAMDARYDAITGLLKRGPFEKLIHTSWHNLANPGDDAALIQIDIDSFNLINDASGHATGDQVLRDVAKLILRVLPDEALVTRLGADDYGVFLPATNLEVANKLAGEVVKAIGYSPFLGDDEIFDLTVSIGISGLSCDTDLSTALTECDIACSSAKELGGNRIWVYDRNDVHLSQRHAQMQWASKLRSAVDDRSFELFGQAIQHTNNPFGPPAHIEVLLRLFDDDGTVVSPAIFIPAAERYGFVDRIDRMVVKNALTIFEEYQARGVETGISINISGPSMCNDEFRAFAVESVMNSNVRPETLSFEITETAAIGNLSQALAFIEALSNVGCRFSLDDFGSGMSSYAYLRQLPVDYVKIDGSFVKNMVDDPFNRSLVESINQISHASGKYTVAEFVENEDTLAVLAEIGVDFAQGYVMDRPGPLVEKLEVLVPSMAAAIQR